MIKMNFYFMQEQKKKYNKIYAVGGRVLNFVSLSDDFNLSKKKYY